MKVDYMWKSGDQEEDADSGEEVRDEREMKK